MTDTIRVTVDPKLCAASQTCMRIAPGRFELAAEGYARATRAAFAHEDAELLHDAEDSCPTGAIRVAPAGDPRAKTVL